MPPPEHLILNCHFSHHMRQFRPNLNKKGTWRLWKQDLACLHLSDTLSSYDCFDFLKTHLHASLKLVCIIAYISTSSHLAHNK